LKLLVPPIQFKVMNIATLNKVTIVEIKEESFPLCYLPFPSTLVQPHPKLIESKETIKVEVEKTKLLNRIGCLFCSEQFQHSQSLL